MKRKAGLFIGLLLLMMSIFYVSVNAENLYHVYDEYDMLVLPGGMPGTLHLKEHQGLGDVLKQFFAQKKYMAAICAAPIVFGKYGFLQENSDDRV